MYHHARTPDPDGFFDYGEPRFQLTEYQVCSRSPLRDPLHLSRSVVVAPSAEEAMDYLIDVGGWAPYPDQTRLLYDNYTLVPSGDSSQANGMSKSEWINAVLLGYVPRPVRLVEGARIVKKPRVAKQRTHKLPGPPRRMSFMERSENFFCRQDLYPRTWKAIGIVVAVLATAAAIWMLWNLLVSLITLYLVVKAIMACLGSR